MSRRLTLSMTYLHIGLGTQKPNTVGSVEKQNCLISDHSQLNSCIGD